MRFQVSTSLWFEELRCSQNVNNSRVQKMFQFHPDTVQNVRKLFSLDNEVTMKESIDLLEDWIIKQDHFVKKNFGRAYLERMLIAAKGSVERTKERLDRACTLRNLMPHFFEDFDAKEKLKDTFGKVELIMFPKLTDDNRRCMLCAHYGNEFNTEMFLNVYKYSVLLLEYARIHDYASGYEIILDYRHAKVAEIIPTFSVMNLRDLAVIVIEGYGVRVKGIHLIIDSSFIEIVMSLAKQIVPKKLKDRINVYKTAEDLHKVIPVDVLPVELGGMERSSHEIYADWVEEVSSKQFREYWREMIKAKTDETRRTTDKFHEQYMGMPGSFRTLSVD